MRTVNIIRFGKIKSGPIQDLLDHYTKLVSRFVDLNFKNYKDVGERKITLSDFQRDQGSYLIAMTESGKTMSTEQFKSFLVDKINYQDKLEVIFGNAYGLERDIVEAADIAISLSPMTLPHELSQVVFLEQLYRVSDMLKGGSYHK